MSFSEKTLSTLEFYKICGILSELAPTEGARQKVAQLRPTNDIVEIRRRLQRTTAAKKMLTVKGMPSFGNIGDVGDSLERAEKGSPLTPLELLNIANVLQISRGLLDYNHIVREANTETVLDEIFDRLIPNRSLETRITRSILAEDLIADEASSKLAEIRRKIRNTNSRIKEILQKYTSGGSMSKYMQENIVTTRSGRFVIPVKAEYRNEVKGLVHDTSASGATLFVEPMAIVDANNELRELQSAETHEIEKILLELSAMCAGTSREIQNNYRNATELAFIFACAELSVKMDAAEPVITEKREVFLDHARHPLLNPATVVPITVRLGGDYTMLVVTGPNTGGKTVTLKTLGLLSLMAQAGLHIPAYADSRICVFDDIFSDIGDEQSIEQSLSTFSSHMVGIVAGLHQITADSLALFDELGAGTDPVEGAALAMAILEEIRARGTLCAATTHYSELKAYAVETDGVVNASCEFDVQTLRPTYRLMIGNPGKSNAFAISEKLGLPDTIVQRARQYVDAGSRNFDEVIARLEAARQSLEEERNQAGQLRREYETFKTEAEKELREKLSGAEQEAEKRRAQAEQLLLSAKATSNFVFEQLEQVKKQRDSEQLAARMAEAKRKIRAKVNGYENEAYSTREDDDESYVLPRPLEKGDRIVHRNLGTSGIVLEVPDKNGNVSVRLGQVKTRANVRDLKLVGDAETPEERNRKNQKQYRTLVKQTFKPELDVRGQTGEEAWNLVDQYLDEANVASFKTVTIIHGKGTGALRTAIWNYLKQDRRVASFRAGVYGEGDYGVTVVELKG